MALEKMRKRWESALQPVLNAFSSFSPATVTWMALPFGVAGGLLATYAPDEASGGWWLLGGALSIALAMLFDGLDGSLARAKGEVTRWGDYLDHTIDRVVDIGIIVAIGFNSDFGVGPSLGFGAALLTLMGSYMGTQAQSVGLGRIYGGFSRADRMVITIIGLSLAGLQAADLVSFSVTLPGDIGRYAMLGLDQLNGFGLAVVFSAYGGFYTFVTRFFSARAMLTQSVPES